MFRLINRSPLLPKKPFSQITTTPIKRAARNFFVPVFGGLVLAACKPDSTATAHSANNGCKELNPTTIYMIGDSTMANKPIPNDQNERGWGQAFAALFADTATVVNAARNGRSSRSFTDEGHWQKVKQDLAAGDWLIIQFGHNDQKTDERYTAPFAAYSDNLARYANTALAAGAHPIIATSIVRGADLNSHGDYPRAAKKVAKELAIPLLDLEALTMAHVAGLRDQKTFYVQKDSTHLNAEGAKIVARMAAQEIDKMQLSLACYIRATPDS